MKTKHRSTISFYLNGTLQNVGPDQARLMLADYLRETKRLTGTKIVCAEGDCGACSVLRLQPPLSRSKRSTRYLAINSCITTVAQMDGSNLVTVDALATSPTQLSPIQKSMMDAHGSQCGFCTPGFVVAMTGLVEKKLCSGMKKGSCSSKEAMNAMTGNLCRCTGYQPIVDAATQIDLSQCKSLSDRFANKTQVATLSKLIKTPVQFQNQQFSFYAPTKISDAVKYLAKNREARLLGAGTDLGVVHNKGKIELVHALSLHLIPELYQLKASGKRMKVGARVTLAELRDATKKPIPEFSRFLDLFASPQIKNVATLIGNIGNASPIADTPPFLLVANSVLHLVGPKGKRKISIDQYYVGYRKTALKPGEFITAIEFDIPTQHEKLKLYKASQRKDLDISAMNAGLRVQWTGQSIKEIKIALGGVAATPVRLKKTETFLKGKNISKQPQLLEQAMKVLQSEINPLDDLRGTSKFRRVLVENLMLKFFREHLE